MSGKVVLVTGSTDGIGKHTANNLLRANATVLVHGRNATRVADTVSELQQSNKKSTIGAYTEDVSTVKGAHALAKKVAEGWELDVLVNNAAVYEDQLSITHDGYETTWATNVLAPFILMTELLPRISQRIVNVSSISAAGSLDWGGLDAQIHGKRFSAHSAYSLSKLAVQMFTAELAERAPQLPSTLCLDPGTVNTKMLLAGWGPCGIDVRDANDLTWAATAPNGDLEKGTYYVGRRSSRPSRPAQDSAERARLWDLLTEQAAR